MNKIIRQSEPSGAPRLGHQVQTRLPIAAGDFETTLFLDDAGNEHIVLSLGDLRGAPPLIRVHSECFTGDVLGSRRCDCGEQLDEALRHVAAEGRGAVLYLRQEGRGIGLTNKLRAYNLQDAGLDTVDANLELGYLPDSRDYGVAAAMLRELGVEAVRLMTNNPAKVEGLRGHGIDVRERVPIEVPARPENLRYLEVKARRMGHLLEFRDRPQPSHRPLARGSESLFEHLGRRARARERGASRPFVTLSYAQSLDGSSAAMEDRPLAISGDASLRMTHQLRAAHDGILIGIGTVLADNPQLTVRAVEGQHPRPVVVDSRLRFPIDARLLAHPSHRVLIATTSLASPERARRLEQLGAEIVIVERNKHDRVDLDALMACLAARGMASLMVEGGGRVLTQLIARRLIDLMVVTVAPTLVGGVPAFATHQNLAQGDQVRLAAPRYVQVGDDLVVWGQPVWGEQTA